MPSWSSEISSSRPEHIMPKDSTPRILPTFKNFAAGRNFEAGAGEHNLDAGPRIGRATYHLDFFGAGIDLTKMQPVGVGVLIRRNHLGDDKAGQFGGRVFDGFDFEADRGQFVRDGRRIRLGLKDNPSTRKPGISSAKPSVERRNVERGESHKLSASANRIRKTNGCQGCRISASPAGRCRRRRQSLDSGWSRCRNSPVPSD